MKTIFVMAALLLIVTAAQSGVHGQMQTPRYSGKVVSVEDGKTLTLLVDDKKIRVLLLAIGAPTQALKKDSRENLKRLVSGKQVRVFVTSSETGGEKEETVSGKVMLDNQDIGLEQIRGGFAWHASEVEQYQSPEDRMSYWQAEQSAKESKRGLWSGAFKECKGGSAPINTNTSANAGRKSDKKLKVFGISLVEVEIDTSGDVVSARALCGHPILQTLAVQAAMQWKFQPSERTIVGTITFNFVPE